MIRSPDQSATDLIISAIFQLYRPQLQLYRRFFNYIDLPTKTDNDRSSLLKDKKNLDSTTCGTKVYLIIID